MTAELTPPKRLTVSEWADEHRVLSPEATSETGRWHTSRAQYLRGIMDAPSEPGVHTVAVRKAAQVGWTEVLNNVLGYHIDHDPAPILFIQPTVRMAETWSKKRLTPMLRDTTRLHGKVADPKSRNSDNTILEKGFPGGYLAVVGANTPNDLASRPMRVVIADEADKYPPSAGDFGDPLSLAESRQETFWNRLTLVGSTPGRLATSTIQRKFEEGDQRHYLVPCPFCDHPQALRWDQVTWDKDETGHLPETAGYECEECHERWSDAERWHAIATAEDKGWGWVASAPFTGIASFSVPGFLSSWLTMAKIVRRFLVARKFAPLMRVWVNEVKGEAWEERGEKLEAAGLAEGVEVYDGDTLPDVVRIVTAGVDTQDDRLEVTFVAWAAGEEAWVIAHEIILGDPAGVEPWNDLDARLRHAVFTTESGRTLRVRATCIDSGGHRGAMVLAFAKTRASRRIYATKGIGNDHRGSKPIWGKSLLNTKNAGDRLWAIGVDTAKDDLAARLRIVPGAEPTARAIHFPATDLPIDYFEQLTAEQAVTELNTEGRPVRRWKMKPKQERNEALDCFIMAHAAMLSLGIRLMAGPIRTGVPVTEAEAEVAAVIADEDGLQVAVATVPPPPVTRRRERWKGYGG